MTVLFDPAWQLRVGVNRANCELAMEAGGEQQGLGVAAQPSAVGVSRNLGGREGRSLSFTVQGDECSSE